MSPRSSASDGIPFCKDTIISVALIAKAEMNRGLYFMFLKYIKGTFCFFWRIKKNPKKNVLSVLQHF